MRHAPQKWLHYIKDIIAADVYSAVLLARYMRSAEINKMYLPNVEIIDLRRSKIFTKSSVSDAINADPFIFVVGKN